MPKGVQGEANKKGRAICHPSRLEVLGATFHARLRVHIVRSRNARRDDRLYDKTQANELFEGGAKFALTDSELVGGVLRRHPERLGLLGRKERENVAEKHLVERGEFAVANCPKWDPAERPVRSPFVKGPGVDELNAAQLRPPGLVDPVGDLLAMPLFLNEGEALELLEPLAECRGGDAEDFGNCLCVGPAALQWVPTLEPVDICQNEQFVQRQLRLRLAKQDHRQGERDEAPTAGRAVFEP